MERKTYDAYNAKAVEDAKKQADEEGTGWKELIDTSAALYRPVELLVKNIDVRTVICDEGQAAKNPRATIHKTVIKIKKEFVLIASATPALNSVFDWLGYVDLIWPAWVPFYFQKKESTLAALPFLDDEVLDELRRSEGPIDVPVIRGEEDDLNYNDMLPGTVFEMSCRRLLSSGNTVRDAQ